MKRYDLTHVSALIASHNGSWVRYEDAAALQARAEAAERQLAWQSMESAPREGEEVLLVVEMRAGIPGKMLVGHYMPGGHCIEDHPPIDAGWYFWNGKMFDRAAKPMAWLPLPLHSPALEAALLRAKGEQS